MYGEIVLFSGNGNPELARRTAQALAVPLSPVDIFQFPNQNVFCRLHASVRNKDVFIIQPIAVSYGKDKVNSVNDNLMELLVMIDTVKRDSAGRITAVVPYYGYGRTDKKDQPRVPITARLVADLITTAGADRFLTVDLHAGQIQGFFNIPVDEITAFYLMSDYIREKNIPNAVVVAADIGATKRARNFAQALDLPLAVIEKRRIQRSDGSSAEALNVIGDVGGKNCIIFDDEIDTAGTVTQAMAFLKASKAEDIYACVTHAPFSDPAVERLTKAPVKEVTVTDTINLPTNKRMSKLTVLSVGPVMAEVIRRIHLGLSVGEFFNE